MGLTEQSRNDKQRRKPDLRIRRTRSLLSNALVALMQEKSIDKITVQEVLDRATVGRSTFYLHYRDKDDLFLCVLEVGLELWSTALLRKQEKSYRVAPVAEFFMHVGDAKKLYRALVDTGRIHAFFELAQGYFARGVARRLKDMGLKNLIQSELDGGSPSSDVLRNGASAGPRIPWQASEPLTDRNSCCRLSAHHLVDEVPIDVIELEVEGSRVSQAVTTDGVGFVEDEASKRIPVHVEIPPNVMEPEGPRSNLSPYTNA